MVEQKAELKGRSERRVGKVAEEHNVVCKMQLEMVVGDKKQGCGDRSLDKNCGMMCDCMAELGVDRKWTLHQTKAKMTQGSSETNKIQAEYVQDKAVTVYGV